MICEHCKQEMERGRKALVLYDRVFMTLLTKDVAVDDGELQRKITEAFKETGWKECLLCDDCHSL